MSKQQIQTIEARLRRFADALTPEEQEQLRTIRTQMQDVAGMMSASLWDKVQAAVDALTPEELAELGRVLGGAVGAAAGSGAAEVAGYRFAEYEDEYGWKGPLGSNPPPPGKSSPLLGPLLVFGFAVASVLPGAVLVNYPEYRDPNF